MDEKLIADTLQRVLRSLDQLKIQYHLTGGLASIFYGEPRFTQDVDLVIRLNSEEGRQLYPLLSKDFYIQEETLLEAIEERSMFQPLDKKTFIKVDFHVGEDIPGEFDRSQVGEIFPGLRVKVVSKSDAILSKLRWIAKGSGKSEQDIVGMLLNHKPIDENLIESMAREKGWLEIWERVKRTATEKREG